MVQCRTRPSLNSTATQFSGFAFGLKDEGVVQVGFVVTILSYH